MKRMTSAVGLAGWFALTFGVAWAGSRFQPGIWYEQLAKPSWTPPNWLFGPVWSLLYGLMAIAAWLVWEEKRPVHASIPLLIFIGQLVLNAVWSWIFFGLKMPGLAFGEIIVLWLAILLTVITFWRETRSAGALLMPYLAWTSFAVALNFAIWRMNI